MGLTDRIPLGSVELVPIEVEVGEDVDPTIFPAEVALAADGMLPVDEDWQAAEWASGGPPWIVEYLIGSTAETTYEVGVYDVYVRVSADPELPVFPAGQIEIYGDEVPQIIDREALADYLGTTFEPDDARADLACDIASRIVRTRLAQTITLVEDDTLRIEGSFGDRVRLPERPVVEVAGVTLDGFVFPAGAYSVIGEELVLVADSETWASRASGYGSFGGSNSVLEVVYTHGWAKVPDDIRGLALSIAARIFSNPSGAVSEGVLSYRVSYSESFPLLPWENEIVKSYRRTVGMASLR